MEKYSYSLSVPYSVSLKKGIELGAVVKICGFIPENSDRFGIDLMTGDGSQSDVVLHFNPRFDQNKVVLNTRKDGSWVKEEYGKGLPFQHKQAFELMIIADQKGFKIVVGNQLYYHFQYRIPLGEVRRLEVNGMVMLESVNIF